MLKSEAERLFGDMSIMNIPLEQHMFLMTEIVAADKPRWLMREGRYEWDQHCVYRLVDRLVPYVEGDHIPGRLDRRYTVEYVRGIGVCVRVGDHSFGRGLVRIILGWSLIVSVPNRHADEFQRMLIRNAKGQHIRSRLFTAPSTAFNLENENDLEIAMEAKLKWNRVAIVRSQLPIEAGARSDYLIEDVEEGEPYTSFS